MRSWVWQYCWAPHYVGLMDGRGWEPSPDLTRIAFNQAKLAAEGWGNFLHGVAVAGALTAVYQAGIKRGRYLEGSAMTFKMSLGEL